MHSFDFAGKTPLTFRMHKTKFMHFVTPLDKKKLRIDFKTWDLSSLM